MLLGFAFDDASAMQPWISLSLQQFCEKAQPWQDESGEYDSTALRAVLTEAHAQGTIQMKLPAAFLYGLNPLCAGVKNWQGFSAYKPVFSTSVSSVTAPPPVPFAFSRGDLVMCTPPFVSASRGSNTAPTPTTPVAGRVVGIMLGSEWNTTKGRAELRRWVAVLFESPDNTVSKAACLLPLAQVGEWPIGRPVDGVQIPMLTDDQYDGLLRSAAVAKKPGSYNSLLCTASFVQPGTGESFSLWLRTVTTRGSYASAHGRGST